MLRGVTPDSLNTTKQTNLETDNWSYYNTVAGKNITQGGDVFSGQPFDLTVGIAWLRSEIKLTVFDILTGAEKNDYTDAGVAKITGAIQGVLNRAVENGLLDGGDPENGIDPPSVSAPLVSEQSVSDRANRLFPDIEFSGRFAGALRRFVINGTLTV